MCTVIDMSKEDSDAIRKARLLIVDKEWAAARELRDQLTRMGHEVLDVASSAEHAVELPTRCGPT